MKAGPYACVTNGSSKTAAQHRTPAPAASRITVALLAVAPDPAVGAHAFAKQLRQRRLMRLCWQMLAPQQSLQMLLRRLCSQMLVPPPSLQVKTKGTSVGLESEGHGKVPLAVGAWRSKNTRPTHIFVMYLQPIWIPTSVVCGTAGPREEARLLPRVPRGAGRRQHGGAAGR